MELRSSKRLKNSSVNEEITPIKLIDHEHEDSPYPGFTPSPELKKSRHSSSAQRTPVKSHAQILRQLQLQKRQYQKWLEGVFVALITLIGILVLSKFI